MCWVVLLDCLTLVLCPGTLSGCGLTVVIADDRESNMNTSCSNILQSTTCSPDCSL